MAGSEVDFQDRALFESSWPAIALRLEGMLRGRGVPVWLREDVIQETGARLLARWPSLRRRNALWPLADRIARNVLIDHHRELSRVEFRDAFEGDVSSVDEVERTALARLDLRSVGEAMRQLNPRYRDLLVAEAASSSVRLRRGTAAEKMARSRARAQLRRVVGRGRDVVFAPVLPMRRLNNWIHRRLVTISFDGGAHHLVQAGLCALLLGAVVLGHQGESVRIGDGTGTAGGSVTTSLREAGHSDRLARRPPYAAPSDTGSGQALPRSRSRGTAAAGIGMVPKSRGESTQQGSFGPEGYDLEGEGSGTLIGKRVAWRYRHEFRARECVGGMISNGATSGCDERDRPRGYVEAEYDGHRVRAEYGD